MNIISGNKQNSFYEDGFNYNTELNILLKEKLNKGYELELESFLRKTDNTRIEENPKIKLKEINIKIQNAEKKLEAGDIYIDFTPFTINSTLYGIRFENIKNIYDYNFFIAKKCRDECIYDDNKKALGFKIDKIFSFEKSKIQEIKAGFQTSIITESFDITSYDKSVKKGVKNAVISTNGTLKFNENLNIVYEFARGGYVSDQTKTISDMEFGNAIRIQPYFKNKKFNLRYLFYYVEPNFKTELGSAISDKLQNQINLNYIFSPKITLSITENYYFNKLSKSKAQIRTYNDEKYLRLLFLYSESLNINPYVNYFKKNISNAITQTYGVDIFKKINKSFSSTLNYEYRGYEDKNQNEYINRTSIGVNYYGELRKKTLNISLNNSFEKSNKNNYVNINTSVNSRYDISKTTKILFAINLNDFDSENLSSDFKFTRSFIEIEKEIKNNTYIRLKGEINKKTGEDTKDNYTERRIITRFETRF